MGFLRCLYTFVLMGLTKLSFKPLRATCAMKNPGLVWPSQKSPATHLVPDHSEQRLSARGTISEVEIGFYMVLPYRGLTDF